MASAFDGDVSTALRAAGPAKAGDFVSFVPPKDLTVRQVIVVGTTRGEVQVRSGQTWTIIGTISDDALFRAFAVPTGTTAEEVRLMLTAGSPASEIREMTVVDGAPEPAPTPTATPTVTPTSTFTPTTRTSTPAPTSPAARGTSTSGSSISDDHGRPGYPAASSSHGLPLVLPRTGA